MVIDIFLLAKIVILCAICLAITILTAHRHTKLCKMKESKHIRFYKISHMESKDPNEIANEIYNLILKEQKASDNTYIEIDLRYIDILSIYKATIYLKELGVEVEEVDSGPMSLVLDVSLAA